MADSEFLQAALLYASMGWRVFPLQPRQKDRFGCKSWKRDATTDEVQIRAWWGKNPEYNVGVVTGDGLGVIDVDDKPDKHGGILGSDMLADWEFEHGKIAETVCAQSGSGGVHYYFDIGDWPIRKCESPGLSIDLRCNGGYIVAPPSIHPDTGEPYTWDISPEDMAPAKLGSVEKACFQWIWDNRNGNRGNDAKPDKGKDGGIIREGGRNAALFSEGRSMRSKGLDYDLIRAALDGKNHMLCRPPLPDEEVEKIAKSVCNVEPGFSEEVKKQRRGKQFRHNDVARRLMDERGACFIDGMPAVRVGDHYRAGWEHVDSAVIDLHDDATAHNQREVRHYLLVRAPRVPQSRPTLVAFENGVLDMETMELRDPLPSDMIPNVIPHRWNPDAKGELVDATLRRMAAGDDGTLDNLSEIIGLCMFRSARYGYCPVLLGEGSNGKSTYIDMLHAVIGDSNMSALQPREIGQRFQAAQLIGKLANLGDDISNDYIDPDSCATIKKVATGSTMYTDVKGGDGFNFQPYCTMVFSANEFPRLGDSSYGMRRRLFPIAFNARFSPDDPDFDPNIGEKLTSEESCEYMCKLGVYAMLNVMRNGKLTDNMESRRIIDRIEVDNNTVLQWMDDMGLTAEYAVGMTAQEVYSDYQDWCKRNGVSWVGSRKFSNVLGGTWHLKATRIDHSTLKGRRVTVKRYEIQG